MNFEARKAREPTTREEADSNPPLGGIVIAVFACPNCGWIAESSRRRPQTPSSTARRRPSSTIVEPLGAVGDTDDRAVAGCVEHVRPPEPRPYPDRAVRSARRGSGRARPRRAPLAHDQPLALPRRRGASVLADERVEPSGSDSTHSRSRACERSSSSSSVASGSASRRFSRIVESNTCASCPRARTCPHVLLPELAQVATVDRHAAGGRSRNRSRRFVTVVFPAPLGRRARAAPAEDQVEAVEHDRPSTP
jgi:hypothetical protein